MADKLADLFTKAVAGDITPTYLKEQADIEFDKLQEAHVASQDPDRGWMAAMDLLEGETADLKMKDFATRTKALGDATDWIAKGQSAAQAFSNLQNGNARSIIGMPAPPRPGDKQAVDPRQVMNQETAGIIAGRHYQKMLASEMSQKLLALPPDQRLDHLRANRMIAKTPAAEYGLVLKASYSYTGLAAPGGLMPTDVIGMPYPLLTNELDYINITSQAGSIIRFMQSRTPATAQPEAGNQAQVRVRGAVMNEMTETGVPIARTKQPLSGYYQVAREDLRDNGAIGPRNDQQLDISVRDLMTQQIFAGDAGAPQWNGVLADYATTAANLAAITLTSNQIPVPSASGNEPVTFIEALFAHLAQRGCPPSVLFVNANDWSTIRQSQRALRYLDDDFKAAPYGRVGPVPMCLSRYLGANRAFLVDATKAFGVELGQEVETAVSDDFAFTSNLVTVRRTVDGNTYSLMPYGGFLITATNEFTPATP